MVAGGMSLVKVRSQYRTGPKGLRASRRRANEEPRRNAEMKRKTSTPPETRPSHTW